MEFKEIINDILKNSIRGQLTSAKFLQYNHRGSCERPCHDCPERHKRVYENGKHIKLPAHPHCDCYYEDVKTKPVGTISIMGENSPDVWLKEKGTLPDYYITKEEAIEKYGWDNSKNTLSGKAPGKMIGGDIFRNEPIILPDEVGRIWYECDLDYFEGKRLPARLYYSNDGLMFYSVDHLSGNIEIYLVE